MNKLVLDASAILAVVNAEPGHEKLTAELLAGAVASTVKLAEVQAKLVSRGWPPDMAWEDGTGLVKEAVVFDEEQARLAGHLIARTRHLGLSLGDRACLARGIALHSPVYTTDRSWKNLKLKVQVQVIG